MSQYLLLNIQHAVGHGDAFTNWLTANGVNITTQLISTAIGAATGNLATISSNVANLIGEFHNANLLPSIEGGQNTGDVNYSAKNNTFNFYNYHCKTEYMKIIDDYFTRFGYAIKKLELPNITGRKYWNYIEIGANEEIGYGKVPSKFNEEIGYGEVPSKFMDIINNACRKGVTIWHNHRNIGDYSLENSIV